MSRAQRRQLLMASVCFAAGALLLNAVHNLESVNKVHATSGTDQTPGNAANTVIDSDAGATQQHSKTQTKKSSAFSPSLRDTQRDGKLRVDADDNLVIERGIRDLFDYYLTTLGEKDLIAIRNQLQDMFERELPAPAAQQASQLLDAYLRYRQHSGELQNVYPALTDTNTTAIISDYFAARDALRNQLFAPDAVDAFFAADIANEQSATQKLQQLADQHAGSPTVGGDAVTDNYSKYRLAIRASAQITTQDAAGRDALREQLFGREAADRFAALDQQRSDWTARLSYYRAQRQQLLATAERAGIDPAAQLANLQQSQFSAQEIVRIRALDRLQQQD